MTPGDDLHGQAPRRWGLRRLLDILARAMALLAGVCVTALALLIGIDIVAREWAGVSVQGTDELGGYTLALVGSLGLSHTLLKRGHPRIDVALGRLPLRPRAALHAVAHVALAGFACFMLVHAWAELSTSLRFQATASTPLQTPLWIPQSLWVLGTATFALTAVCCAVEAAILAVRDPAAADRRFGTLTADDEVAAYVAPIAAPDTGGTR